MKQPEKITLVSLLFKNLDKPYEEMGQLYLNIFKLLNEVELEKTLDVYLSASQGNEQWIDKENWFAAFHKSLRQTDFFNDGYFHEYNVSLLTSAEEEEFQAIRKKINDTYNKLKLFKEESPTEWERYRTLLVRRKNMERKSISGYLDMILYTTIHVDTDYLYRIMTRTFKEYILEKELEKEWSNA